MCNSFFGIIHSHSLGKYVIWFLASKDKVGTTEIIENSNVILALKGHLNLSEDKVEKLLLLQ